MLRARTSFHAGERLVKADALVHDHDEIVAGREHLFERVADESGDGKPVRGRRSSKAAG